MKIQDLDYEFENLKGEQNAPCNNLSIFPENTPSDTEVEKINAIHPKRKPKNKKG